MFGFDDILIGAGIGALGSALFGGSPLQGAALGGVTGGLLGGMPAGSWAGGGAKALGTTGADLGTRAGFEAAMGLPSTAFLESGGSLGTALGGRTAAMGLTPTVGGTFINPEYSGLINSGSSMWDTIKPYANIQNLQGAANIAQQFQPRPTQVPTAGGSVARGQAPQGTDVMELVKSIRQPERKRISLL